MICCAAAVLLLAAMGLKPGEARPDRFRQHGAWGLWGAGLGGLAYLALVALLLGGGWAVHVAPMTGCGAGPWLGTVPAEQVAAAWTVRTLALLGGTLLSLAAAIAVFLRGGVLPGGGARGSVLAGFAVAWLAVSIADHQGAGLYVLMAGGAVADVGLHAAGVIPWMATRLAGGAAPLVGR